MAFSQIGQGYILWDFKVYPIAGFWAIGLAPDMLESQARTRKTRMVA